MKQFTIIGGGNMGSAFAALCLKQQLAAEVVIIEKNAERRTTLEKQFRDYSQCRILPSLPKNINDTVLLAVKPQDIEPTCMELKDSITHNTVIISIMAGQTINKIATFLAGHKKIVRCMPNTPFQIGKGMTGYYPSPDISSNELLDIEKLLSSGGSFLRVKAECELDGITALSGSGPAYVFYFIEAFIEAATQLGFSSEAANLLAYKTIEGASSLWQTSLESPATLRTKVTSKGGTTAAALNEFESGHVKDTLIRGILAANNRSIELR